MFQWLHLNCLQFGCEIGSNIQCRMLFPFPFPDFLDLNFPRRIEIYRVESIKRLENLYSGNAICMACRYLDSVAHSPVANSICLSISTECNKFENSPIYEQVVLKLGACVSKWIPFAFELDASEFLAQLTATALSNRRSSVRERHIGFNARVLSPKLISLLWNLFFLLWRGVLRFVFLFLFGEYIIKVTIWQNWRISQPFWIKYIIKLNQLGTGDNRKKGL